MKRFVIIVLLSSLLQGSSPTSRDLFYGEVTASFLTRWEFQENCDHVFDPRTAVWAWPTSHELNGARCNPHDIEAGDTVFVRDIDLFMKEIHPLIEHPYIIVTHGEFRDTCKDSQLDYLDDDKIIAWFSIHPSQKGHQKYFPLPLGINQDLSNHKNKELLSVYLKELRETTPKTQLLYMNFDVTNNLERKQLKDLFMHEPFCTNCDIPLPFQDYLAEMARHKFALSPRGWGPDCYRTWEALYVGTIPIVKRNQFGTLFESCEFTSTSSQLDQLYKDLPILIIDDWTELTQEFLESKYNEITSRTYDIRKLHIDFWFDLIDEMRKNYLGKTNVYFLATVRIN